MKEVFVDLDQLIDDIIEFKFKGVVYRLKPLDALTFMKFANEIQKVQELLKKKEITEGEVLQTYVGLISSVCEQVTEEVVLNMTKAQIAALLQLILNFTQGKVHTDPDVEKKSL